MVNKFCPECGKQKEIEKHPICKSCYAKKNNKSNKKSKGGLDTNQPIMFEYQGKQYPIPIWGLGIVFGLGIIIGAMLF